MEPEIRRIKDRKGNKRKRKQLLELERRWIIHLCKSRECLIPLILEKRKVLEVSKSSAFGKLNFMPNTINLLLMFEVKSYNEMWLGLKTVKSILVGREKKVLMDIQLCS